MLANEDHGADLPDHTVRSRLVEAASAAAARCPAPVADLARRARLGVRRHRAPRRFRGVLGSVVADTSEVDLLAVTSTTAVFRVTPDIGPPIILKAANSRAAIEAHCDEADALHELAELVPTGEPRHVIADVLERNDAGATAWFTQTMLAGHAMDPNNITGADVVKAAEAIRPFYELTGDSGPTDDETVNALIAGPIDIIESYFPANANRLEGFRRWLTPLVSGQPLFQCRVHGDFVPQNLLVDDTSDDVVGIVDWTFDSTPLPPEVDLVHFALGALAAQRNEEYGQTVCWLLTSDPPKSEIRPVLAALACGPNLFDLEVGVTLAWLHHVAHSLRRPHHLSSNPLWIANNLNNVIDVLQGAAFEGEG